MLFNFQRWSLHDGPGIRTTVFFKGCHLRCWWCSNPESWSFDRQLLFNQDSCVACGTCVEHCPSGANTTKNGKIIINRARCISCETCVEVCSTGCRELAGLIVTEEEVLNQLSRDAVFYRQSGGGVTFSGGEPFAQPQLLKVLANGCIKLGISVAVETSGSVPFSKVQDIFELFDKIYIDLKHTQSKSHQKLTGIPNETILDTIRSLDKRKKSFTIRVPLVAGLTDTDHNIQGILKLCEELQHPVEIELLPYHELGKGKYSSLGYPYDVTLAAPDSAKIALILAQLNESKQVITCYRGGR